VYSGEAEGYMARSDDCHKICLSALVGARKLESVIKKPMMLDIDAMHYRKTNRQFVNGATSL
jgi:hypothetical protein